jgi:hypothetical protein
LDLFKPNKRKENKQKKCVSAMSIFVRQCSVEDVRMDGRGFPITTTPSACFHPCPFRKISLPSGARPTGCSLSRPPSSPGCLRPRAGARLGCHARPRVLVASRGAHPRVAQCLHCGTGELHTLLPTSTPASSSAMTRPSFVQAAR